MASHVFTRSYRLRPRHGRIMFRGLGAPTVGDASWNTAPPHASYESIVAPNTGLPPSAGPDVDTATEFLPGPTAMGVDATPAQINPAAITPATPNTDIVPTVPGVPGPMTTVYKQDVWYYAGKIAPWAIGGALALGIGTWVWRGMRKSRR